MKLTTKSGHEFEMCGDDSCELGHCNTCGRHYGIRDGLSVTCPDCIWLQETNSVLLREIIVARNEYWDHLYDEMDGDDNWLYRSSIDRACGYDYL